MRYTIIWLIFFPALLHSNATVAADTTKCSYRFNNYYELSLSGGANEFAGALSWAHLHGFGKKKQKFKIGYGLRLTSFAGKDLDYTTAPARLTSRATGPQVLFSETFLESIDTVTFSSAQTNSLNISIQLQYSFSKKIDIGFNIDAIGFSFGPTKTGTLISSIKPSGLSEVQSARPTPFNLLLVSDNDIGSLNSELYLRYWFRDQFAIKSGITFLFSEYTTDNTLIFDNDRFRYKSLMFLLGFTYSPFKR